MDSRLSLFFSNKGRINRKKFILSYLLVVLIGAITNAFWQFLMAHYLVNNIYDAQDISWITFCIIFLPVLFIIYMQMILQIKRLHDINNDGLIAYINFFLGLSIYIFFPIDEFPLILIAVSNFILSIVIMFMCTFLKGVEEENEYGKNPLLN